MTQENKQTVTVQPGGKIEVVVPEFPVGTEVEVTIATKQIPPVTEEETEKERIHRSVQEIQQLIRQYVPEDVMLSEELIQERRRESERE
ncbi:MAG: hypothetical protein GVY17_12710 [Cyanobacteria bacterium]|nr:hypothetical protein [Cyanobacteria bacterium GSL.Bin21]